MNRGLSLWLDVLRVGATLVVVLSHFAYPRFTRGDYLVIRDLNLGSDAVVLFFVVSGFVIAYAAQRDGAPGTYGFNRLTRLWSVLIPAIVLTFAFDRIGASIDPSTYYAPFYQPMGLWDMILRGVSFSNEWTSAGRVRLGTNGPLWSLSYEAAYYMLFGVAVFLRGPRKWALLIAGALLVGPRVLLLMPAWLMGAWLWRHLSRPDGDVAHQGGWRLALGGPALYLACLAAGLPDLLRVLTAQGMAAAHIDGMLGFSDEFLWNALIGVFAVVHLLGMSRLLGNLRGDLPALRWLAGASFSVYVTHYPALHLLDAILPETALARDAQLLLGSLAIGLIFAQIFERRIGPLRAGLRRIWPARANPTAMTAR